MLNQFYKYMSTKLINFLEKEELKGGERFYLQFDNQENVQEFYDCLKEHEKAKPFPWQHEQGAPYNTFSLHINSIRVVVAATINEVTPDYLVTLRNQVSEQDGDWKDTALLSICYETLDSIRGGSSDLQREGMPFHIQTITRFIKDELETNNSLSISEKEIIKFHLDKKLEDVVIQTSLWDYAEVISLIEKGEVKDSDYRSLHLFLDNELKKDTHMKPSDIRRRLEDNYRLFEEVQRIHDYGTHDTELEKLFDEKMVSKLKRENWYETDFPAVKNSYDDNKKNALQYLSSETKKLNKHLTFWERAQLETKVGQRKRHIIVFNENVNDTVEMVFEFDDFLKKKFIDKKSFAYADTSGRKLKAVLPAGNSVKFYDLKYSHNDDSKSTYHFYVLIVPFAASQLEGVEANYQLLVKGSDSRLVIKYEGDSLTFGANGVEATHQLNEGYETLEKEEHEKLTLTFDSGVWEDNSLFFNLRINDTILPIEIKDTDTRSTPIHARRVWMLKREKREHFIFAEDKLKQGTETHYPHEPFKDILYKEKEWVENGYKYVIDGKQEDLVLPQQVEEAYHEYLSFFKVNHYLPSLTYMEPELIELAINYVTSVDQAIREIDEDTLLNSSQKGLFKLGFMVEKGKIWMTSLHPLNVAFQLSLEQELEDERLDNSIIDRLHPMNLLPFIYSETGKLYKPTLEFDYPEWHAFDEEKNVSVGTANEFLATVVEEKMNQYVHHFDYLFLESSQSPLRLNVIQIHNDKEVVRGIWQFLKNQLDQKGPRGMLPIEVTLYRSQDTQSAFEMLSLLQTPAEVKDYFHVDLDTKEFDSVDVLRFIREKINYFKIDITEGIDFQYSHISFYKIPTQDMNASHSMDKMESGISLNGLLSSVVAVSSENDYRTGFGLLNGPETASPLVSLAASYNELAFNMQNQGMNSYSKNKSIVKSTSTEGKSLLEKLYKASSWVTFIDPGVDLDFFQRSSSNLLVIHYNDQHTTSDRYDAITVTDKSAEYKKVIEDYFKHNDFPISESHIDSAIKAFNSINGEWLLRIIGSKGHFAREKISIVSAMKYLESFLDHPNIKWLPISLEEILRVASAVKLNKSEGIFSAKNLKSSGKHSDDILMMGIEEVDDQLFLHFYPVEVKIGGLQNTKASDQIEKTSELFRTHLIDESGKTTFKKKFFRNFFAQILLANTRKLYANGLWTEAEYQNLHRLKARLLNDDFKVGQHLTEYIGMGAVLTFRKDHAFRTAIRKKDIVHVTMLESDAFAGFSQSKAEVTEKFQKGYMDINPSLLLVNLYKEEEVDLVNYEWTYGHVILTDKDELMSISPEKEVASTSEHQEAVDVTIDTEEETIEDSSEMSLTEDREEESVILSGEKSNVIEATPLDQIRIPIGTVEGTTATVHWEFGHKELANRHLLISGRSGQGKTYFIQCLLLELANKGISSIIIDYTDGFKNSQLEADFKDQLGDRLEQFVVLAKKFPINPFKRHQKEIDEGVTITEDDSDVAERMKNIIGSIYPSLGIQQLNAIYQAVIKGMSLYDNKMNLSYLRELLEEDGTGPAKTAVSQMNLLIDKNPFDYENDIDWSFLEKEKGKVFVIQLTGYSEDVQKLITEFILWDLWYYKLQHGNKNLPFPVVLDEAQRLDFSNHAPSAKILTEGRKFGWSGWFATQFLKGAFSVDQVSRLQNAAVKIYFAPTEGEVSSIAASISQDATERKEWEQKLMDLNKGQCIVYGPVVGREGKMMSSKPYLVKILQLDQRINL
ncbi:DNA phosphorothioation-dependent restriction protein DptH [Bacillus litorisediminis]|uniref:DNA phosphorothioation-dependent restriction protein DptH n=1 Tax=Bacillus litorisediminis TaxID=2922713 RepID=UPI001FAEACFE|nr:DNA phosphorothioation-dependent restriction protein DptH [Bacillus litorisediminis]